MSDEMGSLPIGENSDRKVLLFGSVGAGKTTTIKTLCDSYVTGDRIESVALDCGKLKVSNSENLLLYATQGQNHSESVWPESVWKSLHNGMVGIILLIDNRRKDPLRDLEILLAKLSSNDRNMIVPGQIDICQIVIGITHVDSSRTPAVSDYQSFLCNLDLMPQQNPPIFSVDTRSFQDMSMLLQALLYSQDPTMDVLFSEERSYS